MCDECHGIYPNCPICSETPVMCVCENCKGTGTIYLSEEKGIVSYEEWLTIPKNERDTDKCEVCEGCGEIED